MTNKENVILKLKERSLTMDGTREYGIAATEIADSLGIQRNIASHLLNQLHKDGLVVKVNRRPVYFIEKEVYEKRKKELKLVAKHFSQQVVNHKEGDEGDVFHKLTGFDGSLRYIVEQCKAAVSYPPHGLT